MGARGDKYNDIRKSARELFWKHGFKRVTVGEICSRSNVSKMTFYKFFSDKTELAKTIFDDLVSEGEEKFRAIMDSDASPDEKIREVIRMKYNSTMDISSEFVQDFYIGGDVELIAFVKGRTRAAWEFIKTDYIKAQEKGIFRNDFKVELLIQAQTKLIELMDDEILVGLYGSRQELIMEFAKLLVYGITGEGSDEKK